MTFLCIAMSPIFFWFRKNGKNVFVPAILHGTLNAFGGLSFVVFKNPNHLLAGVGIGGIITGTTYSLFFIFRKKKMHELES